MDAGWLTHPAVPRDTMYALSPELLAPLLASAIARSHWGPPPVDESIWKAGDIDWEHDFGREDPLGVARLVSYGLLTTARNRTAKITDITEA